MHQPSLANDSGDILKTYHTRLDGKKRVVIRNPQYTYYEVREFNDGHIELLPRILVSPEEHDAVLSQRTLQMLDTAAQNLAHDVVSAPIDTTELLSLLDDDDNKELEEARRAMKEKEQR